ncbi:MAG: hypothetical protein ACSHWV_02710 [Cellulophaga fucicola]
MKNLILLVGFLLFVSESYAQDCKVLDKNLNKSYLGNCKKGKADGTGVAKGIDIYAGEFKKGWPDGKGTYTWENGNSFEGFFKKGNKEGEGKMIYKTNTTNDSIVTGFWKKNKYVGLYKDPFKKIEKSQNVTAIRVVKTTSTHSKVRLYVRVDNTSVLNPNFNIIVQQGTYQNIQNQNNFVELTNVTFPFRFKATYNSEFIEVEILEAGSWDVSMIIENINGLGPSK